jgi:RNA polymerase sigma factor (sigma-70 family)
LRSDEQLVALFRAGSDEAFRAIHDRYRSRLLAYMRQMLGGSRADAEDALQDVFIRVYAALRADRRPISLRAWLYRIAHNRCVDELRRPSPVPSEIAPGAALALSRGPRHDPGVEFERSEELSRLVADVRRLPDQQRSALLMRELQGLSYEELACALGVSVAAVKSLLLRARTGLLDAAIAREAPCDEIRHELIAAHDRGVRISGRARRHVRECDGCRSYRGELRSVRRRFAALAPAGPFGPLGVLFGLGGGGGAGGGVAVGGGGAALGGATAATATKVAALVCCAALVGTAGSELQGQSSRHRSSAPRRATIAAPATSPTTPAVDPRAIERETGSVVAPPPVAPIQTAARRLKPSIDEQLAGQDQLAALPATLSSSVPSTAANGIAPTGASGTPTPGAIQPATASDQGGHLSNPSGAPSQPASAGAQTESGSAGAQSPSPGATASSAGDGNPNAVPEATQSYGWHGW